MASRIHQITEKKTPFLNFKINMVVPFSVCLERSLVVLFDTKTDVDNINKSKELRKFIFNKLKINDERDLNKIPGILEAQEAFRDSIYKALNTKNFSKMVKEEFIEPYLKRREE